MAIRPSYYKSADGQIDELAYWGGNWHHLVLTTATGGPSPAFFGLGLTSTTCNGVPRIYYDYYDSETVDGRIDELAYWGGNWHHLVVVVSTPPPPVVPPPVVPPPVVPPPVVPPPVVPPPVVPPAPTPPPTWDCPLRNWSVGLQLVQSDPVYASATSTLLKVRNSNTGLGHRCLLVFPNRYQLSPDAEATPAQLGLSNKLLGLVITCAKLYL